MTHSASIIASIPPVLVSIDAIAVAPENPRSDDTVDQAALETLAENIATKGVLTPLIGYMDDGTAWITAGGRRTRALKLLAERGAADGLQVPVIFRNKHLAIEAGHAEQLTHERMSPIDELRIFQLPEYAALPDATLGAQVGRAARYVAQRRKILALPAAAIEALFQGEISMDQASGLTYFGDREASLLKCLAAMDGPDDRHRNGDWAKREAQRGTDRAWSDYSITNPKKPLVLIEEYEAAGGTLIGDLFSEDKIVANPDILHQIAEAKRAELVKAEAAGWGPVVAQLDSTGVWSIPGDRRHEGVDKLTAEERAEYNQMWRHGIEKSIASAQNDEERKAAEAKLARYDDLEKRAKRTFPAKLKKLLEVHWAPIESAPYILTRTGIIPLDREPLYEAGFLDRPTTTAADPDALPQSLRDRINRILTHCLRLHLAEDPDHVIAMHVRAFHGALGYSAVFATEPRGASLPGPDLTFTVNDAWEAMTALADYPRDDLRLLTAEVFRKMAAHRMLLCLMDGAPRTELTAARVRQFWTPDVDFLKAYKAPQLATMRAQLSDEDPPAGQKKAQAIADLVELAQGRSDWLPIGFDGIGGAA